MLLSENLPRNTTLNVSLWQCSRPLKIDTQYISHQLQINIFTLMKTVGLQIYPNILPYVNIQLSLNNAIDYFFNTIASFFCATMLSKFQNLLSVPTYSIQLVVRETTITSSPIKK